MTLYNQLSINNGTRDQQFNERAMKEPAVYQTVARKNQLFIKHDTKESAVYQNMTLNNQLFLKHETK